MTFAWPIMLLSLGVLPLIVFGYLVVVWRRDAEAASSGLRVTEAGRGRWIGMRIGVPRRHVAPALFLIAIGLLLVSLARPRAVLAIPHLEGTVILAFDVSTSMRADDLQPSRVDAAREAARAFVRKQPSTVRVGVVAFSDSAFMLQQPTDDAEQVLSAIDRLAVQGGTSLSEGMFTALGAIAGKQITLPENADPETLLATDIGHFSSAAIVLLTDGEHLSRTDPLDIAELAAGAGVRVYPIGLGKPQGTTVEIDGYRVATALNEPLLQSIADATEGTYLRAEDEAQLIETYRKIDLKLTTTGKETEVTSAFAAASMLLLFAGGVLTTRWYGRVP